ncbi:MAG: hypothetical protein HRU19_20310 [Pseudobacteriovorax sp.]|nr:hypothetical protein [Pseudobacteriovorax sp.]
MRDISKILAAAICLSSPLAAATGELEVTLGTAELDFESGGDDDAGRLAAAYLIPFEQEMIRFMAGGTISRSTVDGSGYDASYIDISATGKIEYKAGQFVPYGRMDVILYSNGDLEVDGGGDADLENSGYEIAGGVKYPVNPLLSFSLETAILANKSFDIEGNNGQGSDELDYDYGLFDSFNISMQYKM